MEILTNRDFKRMPWKNGTGVTTELLRIERDDKILFRLSVATVTSDGPFSLFPHLSRYLLVLRGEGVRLKSPDFEVELTSESDFFRFSGDIPIHCELLGGTVQDFNLIYNESYASIDLRLSKASMVVCHEGETFLFLPEKFELLRLLEGDQIFIQDRFIEVKFKKAGLDRPLANHFNR